MKKKLLLLCFLPLTLVACGNGSDPSSIDFSSYVVTDEDYQHLFDAATLKNNDSFTGYRINLRHTAVSSNEVLYREDRFVFIDRVQNYYEVQKTITKIASSADSMLPTEIKEEHVYYDQGSQYVLQDDNSFKQIDGTINHSSLIFKFNPTKDSFENIDFTRNYNVYNFKAGIVASKANELFATTGLDGITNSSMAINVIEDNVNTIDYSYTINGSIAVTAQIAIFYDPYTITLPVTR